MADILKIVSPLAIIGVFTAKLGSSIYENVYEPTVNKLSNKALHLDLDPEQRANQEVRFYPVLVELLKWLLVVAAIVGVILLYQWYKARKG